MMFCQRFANIYFAVHRTKHSSLSIFEDSRKLLICTGIISVITQLWVPVLINEVAILSHDGNVQGTNCSADVTIVNEKIFKWIVTAESLWVYFLPFMITVLTDFAVLIFTRESKWSVC